MADLRSAVYVAPPIPAKVPGKDFTTMWSPISCTLIYSATEAVLVDTPITIKQTEDLIAWIEKIAPNRKLSYIYVTHGHLDHFGGIPLLLKRFPEAVPLGTPGTIKHMEQQIEETYFNAAWEARFPGQIYKPFVLAQPLTNHVFKLQDRWELHAIECGHSDTYDSTVLWVPALRLAVCGDVVYGQVHQMLMEANTKAKREEWIRAVETIEALDPVYVVPGHRQAEEIDGVWHLAATKKYIRDFGEIVEKGPKNAREVFAEVMKRLLGVDAQQPVTDYNMTVQEAYVYATRHFVSRIQDAQIWMVGNRRSAKSISGLPTWVPDYQQSWQDEHENSFLKFPQPAPFLGKTIPTDAFSNESSLYIHGYSIDRIVFRLTVTRDVDIYEMLLPAVLALASQGRSIYDVYPGKGSGSNSGCEVVGLGETGESKVQTPEENDDVTNGQVLLGTVMDMEGVSAKESLEILSYLAWALSHDQRAPPQSRIVPGHMLEEVASWNSRSEASKYFSLQVLKRAEDRLYYDKDLVYTENGYFGITNGGEAEEDLAIAVIAGAKDLTMLERKQNGDQECWFEYVDNVWMNYARKVEKLEEISGGAKMERLEIR
ncbi:metallo-beta-lactamase domain-containing protein [Colletotrichum karsti]|uniref:Metallo-beta-lactamase domain-containing protein n=1 Tax=Colletotrichum karsti TaxID=1095194 RepID=A0A9P6HZX3_9PEZI|nr:metallo-beta-lactamase domain-containing protein [Colletotrichum karsti]KAF9873739.1 metallo-beta-lactamase domain-containing protein [Colletotrichum karsti]